MTSCPFPRQSEENEEDKKEEEEEVAGPQATASEGYFCPGTDAMSCRAGGSLGGSPHSTRHRPGKGQRPASRAGLRFFGPLPASGSTWALFSTINVDQR